MQQAYDQQRWADVAGLLQPAERRPASADFELGMAFGHLREWKAAHAALLAGERECPRQERFPVELAGVAFEEKNNPEAAAWLRRALRLDPHDDYANNFAGTVYYLMGNLPAALHFWNRVSKPYLANLDLDAQLRVRRLLASRAFTFSPAAVLTQQQLETTEARLDGLGIFASYNIVLNARADGSFDAAFHAMERDGFGATPLQAAVAIFSGLPYDTIYPSYYDMGRSAVNAESLLRWDPEKRRAWATLSGPLHNLPSHRWSFTGDVRDENWAIRRSSSGVAPVLGSLNLEWQRGGATVTSFTSGRLRWSLAGELSHRSYRNVVEGSALTPSLLPAGYALDAGIAADRKLVDLPQRRFRLDADGSADAARLWSTPSHVYEKIQGGALAHWFPEAQSDRWEASQRVRWGALFGTYPFDELFMLGVERDNDLWLRGHIGTRDGRKGSAPMGDRYLLTNSDLYRRIYNNGLLEVQVGPLVDVGRMGAPTSGLSTPEWLIDTGLEARLTVLGTHVIVTWGRDLRNGGNAFFATAQ